MKAGWIVFINIRLNPRADGGIGVLFVEIFRLQPRLSVWGFEERIRYRTDTVVQNDLVQFTHVVLISGQFGLEPDRYEIVDVV